MNGKGIKVKEANKWVRGVVGLLSCPILESSFNIWHLFVVYYTNNRFGLLKAKERNKYIWLYLFLCINVFGENKGILVWRVTLEQGDEIEAMTDRWASGVHSMLFTSRLFYLSRHPNSSATFLRYIDSGKTKVSYILFLLFTVLEKKKK